MTVFSPHPQPALPPQYFDYPDSYHLPRKSQLGLYPVAILGILSLFTTFASMSHLIYRMYTTPALRRNQSLLLILNLLFADFQQAMSFALGLHWAITGTILAPTDVCTAQAWLIQIGDLASGLFSLAIAAQTWRFLVVRRGMSWNWFCIEVGLIWAFCIVISVVGPIKFGERFFVRAGVWCWVGDRFKIERLAYHYVWIFICEFGSILLYAVIFLTLHYRTQNASLTRVARYMLLYPFAYTCLTLPLATFRMASYSGRRLDDSYFIAAGGFMASCGWVDVALYVWTRRRVFKAAVEGEGGPGQGARALASFYGNTTTVGRWDGPDNGDMPEIPVREGVVKLEHVVRVTVEQNKEFAVGGGRVKTLGEGTHAMDSRGW